MRTTCRVANLLYLVTTLLAQAQSPGTFDTLFTTLAGTDQTPTQIAHATGGRLLVAGAFTNYANAGRAGLVRLHPDGTLDTGLTLPKPVEIQPPIVFNGQVFAAGFTNPASIEAVLALADGRIVVAGDFTHLGNNASSAVALVTEDGTPQPFAAQPPDLEPLALLPGPGNTFYVAGGGTVPGGLLPLLRLLPDGTRDPSFSTPVITNLNLLTAGVGSLLPGPGDTFYAVLNAVEAGFKPRFELVRFTASGALDTTFNGTGRAQLSFSTQFQFATAPGGQLVMYGTGQYRGAALPRKLSRLTLTGDFDDSFTAAVEPAFAGTIAVQADGKVLLTGANQGLVVRLNTSGTLDTGYVDPAKVPPGRDAPLFLRLFPAPDGSLHATGFGFVIQPTFQQISGVYHVLGDPNTAPSVSVHPVSQTNTFGARTRFVVSAQGAPPLTYQWTRNGVAIPDATASELILEPSTAADRNADFACSVSNGQGSTTSTPARLTLLEATAGSIYQETDVPSGPNGQVFDLQLDHTEQLFAAGNFTRWNGLARVRAVRLLPGGRIVDANFDTGTQLNGVPLLNSIYPLRSGQTLVQGNLDVSYGGRVHFGFLRLNADGSVDTTFNPIGAGSLFSVASGARPAEDIDGKVLIFDQGWNDEPVDSYLRLNADGTRDTSFAVGGTNYRVGSSRSMLRLPNGQYLVTASLLTGNPGEITNPNQVLRLHPDGTVDRTFVHDALQPFAAGGIAELVLQPDGRILVAGDFTTGGLENLPLLVMRLEADGRLDRTFNPVPRLCSSPAGKPQHIALQADGRILVQSRFSKPGLLRLWPNGVLDPEFAPGVPSVRSGSSEQLGLAVTAANDVFIGGTFEGFNGFPRTNFVRLNGGPLHAIPAPPTILRQPTRLVAQAGTDVTLAVETGGQGPLQFQWRRNQAVGSTNFVDLIGATNASLTLPGVRVAPRQDSGLYQLAIVNPGGAVFSAFITLIVEPDPAVPGHADTSFAAPAFQGILTSQPQISDVNPDGTVYASIGQSVVRLLEDGTRDLTFNPPADLVVPPAQPSLPEGGISVVKRQPDGKILLAGRMKDGALVRLLPDGQYDPEFIRTNAYGGFFQNVPWALGLQRDGRILLAGTFENFAGRSQPGLVRLLPDGQFDESFNPRLIADVTNPPRALPGSVVTLHVLNDDRIYIVGGFNQVQGVPRSGVARLLPDGSLDTNFTPPAMSNVGLGDAGNFTLYAGGPLTPEGGLYVFGRYQFELNGPIHTALRLRPDGSEDSTFRVTSDFQINAAAVQSDGKLIVTGQFQRLNNANQSGFGRLNLDGSTDTTFTPTTSLGVGVGMSMLPDGKLLADNVRYFTGIGPTLPMPKLGFALTPGGLQLNWPSGFRLQRTPVLFPAQWVDTGATAPFTVPIAGPGAFYRLMTQP